MAVRVDHPIILGIVGDSASGKTTLSAGVAQILGEDHCTVLCTDDYHRYTRSERADLGLSALDPRANYIDVLEQHLRLLRRGEPVLKPVYDHTDGNFRRQAYVKPKEFVIAEGLLGYTTRAMRDCYDVKIYLDPAEELRFKWKVHRDTTKRGYSREQVVASLEKRAGDSSSFIHPAADFRRYRHPLSVPEGRERLRHPSRCAAFLRPTLPHPDFSPLFDGSTNAGLHLELARDRDGKPVDVLEINANISDNRAERIEDLLWNLIPEAGHLRDQVGRIDVGNGNGRKSHSLALTQLLVGYHAVKAAMGVRAY